MRLHATANIATANATATATANIDPNSHSHCFRQSDTDTQTNPHSETPHDTEAAPDSAAKAERSEPMIR